MSGNDNTALIASQLIAANIMRGENINTYLRRNNGVPVGIDDGKLIVAVQIAKRLVELSKE